MVPADSDKVSRASPYSGYSSSAPIFAYGACTSYGRPFNAVLLIFVVSFSKSYNPSSRTGLATSAFARRYRRNHCLFSFTPGTKMFQFPGLLSHVLCIQTWMTYHYVCRVPPFGYPRIVAFVPLPVAFRRLMRPSSAVSG